MASTLPTRETLDRLHGLGAAITGRLHREGARLRERGQPVTVGEATGMLYRLAGVIGQDVERLRRELKEGRAVESPGEQSP